MVYCWKYVLHADLDAFYASIEQRDSPLLQGKPVVVGASPEYRGVVAAASYEARSYGIRSSTPMRTAMRLCPSLTRVSPNFVKYKAVSDHIMAIFNDTAPRNQKISIDEAYLDVSFLTSWEQLKKTAQNLKARVFREVKLPISIGGGKNKTIAKLASRIAKPNGLFLVEPGTETSIMAPLGVEMLSGIGPKSSQLLRRYGIFTIGDLAHSSYDWLHSMFGKRGHEFKGRTLGIDSDPISSEPDTKSVSAEITLVRDQENEDILLSSLHNIARDVSSRLAASGISGKTISVKFRLADFQTFSRQITIGPPTRSTKTIYGAAKYLLQKELRPGLKFRLLGIRVSNFTEEYQLSYYPQPSAHLLNTTSFHD